MLVRTKCPHCGSQFKVDEKAVGRNAKCVKCGERFMVEAVPEPVPAPTPEPVQSQAPAEGSHEFPAVQPAEEDLVFPTGEDEDVLDLGEPGMPTPQGMAFEAPPVQHGITGRRVMKGADLNGYVFSAAPGTRRVIEQVTNLRMLQENVPGFTARPVKVHVGGGSSSGMSVVRVIVMIIAGILGFITVSALMSQ